MKVIRRILWPLLMLGLLSCAIVLPRFIQKSQKKPTPPQDLAAALAAVQLPGDEDAPQIPELSAEYRDDPKFAPFLASLEEQDYEQARSQLVELSPTLDEESMRTLTNEMERSVSVMSVALVEEDEPTEDLAADTGEVSKPADPPELSPADNPLPDAVPVVATAPQPKKEVNVRPFFAAIRKKDFAAAEKFIENNQSELSDSMEMTLVESLSSAKQTAQELEASQAKLSESEKQFVSLQSTGVEDIKKSVEELVSATETAKAAAEEASQLRKEIEEMKRLSLESAVETADPGTKKSPDPLPKKKKIIAKKDLPATVVVPFNSDSAYLPPAEQERLNTTVESMRKESALAVQLRGFADRNGASDYNAVLAMARCEVIKDFLIEEGIDTSRIEVISFGETMNQENGEENAVPRRVEVHFKSVQ